MKPSMMNELSNSDKAVRASQKILFLYGKGGHGTQGASLHNQFLDAGYINTELWTEEVDGQFEFSQPVKIVEFPRMVGYGRRRLVCVALSFFKILWMAAARVKKLGDAHLVLSLGPGFVIPIALVLRLRGINVLHIESWSRFDSVSTTTKILRFLGCRIAIQNQGHELLKSDIYIGRITL